MMIVALGCVPHDLEITCFGTLAKYVRDGHDVCLIIDQRKELWTKEISNSMMASAKDIGISKIYFVKGLSCCSVTQQNVMKLREHIETLKPTIAIFPSIRTRDHKRRIFARSCLLACRGVENIMMYDPQKNNNFHPTIYSIMTRELKVKESCLEYYYKSVSKNKILKKNMMLLHKSNAVHAGIKAPVEAFETNRVLLLDKAGF